MSTQLFVGKLPLDTVEKSLDDLFSQFGQVTEIRIVIDRKTKLSRGFGFVSIENEDDAKKAIESLNDTTFEGQTIVVTMARPREETPRHDEGNKKLIKKGTYNE